MTSNNIFKYVNNCINKFTFKCYWKKRERKRVINNFEKQQLIKYTNNTEVEMKKSEMLQLDIMKKAKDHCVSKNHKEAKNLIKAIFTFIQTNNALIDWNNKCSDIYL